MNLATSWPWILAAVLLLSLVILVLMVLLLRRSAKVSEFRDADEPMEEETPQPEESVEDDQPTTGLASVFRRATKLLSDTADGDRHDVPLFLLAGAAVSRPSDLLAAAGLDLPNGTPEEAGVSLGLGRGFWFFDRGVVLDVAGDLVLRSDGKSSDERGWSTLLHRIQKLRPKRPLDGIILTLPCTQLLEAATNEIARAELATRMGRVYRKLWDAQQRLGFRLPTYVLVTGCESMEGFASLCANLPARSRNEILGWSSPYSIESAYRSNWAEEAVTGVVKRLQDVQMEVFTSAASEAETLLTLPSTIRSLALPLRVALDQIFKSSAYHGALVLRGIYFCGREGDAPEEGSVFVGRTAFLGDLVEQKIFPEHGLAMPTAKMISSRNRAVKIAQIGAAAALVIFGLSLGWSAYRLSSENAVLRPFLEKTLANVQMVRGAESKDAHEALSDEALQEAAVALLDGMSQIDFRHYGSITVPSSWFSPFNSRLQEAFGRSFDDVILLAIRHELEEEAWSRIEGEDRSDVIEPEEAAAVAPARTVAAMVPAPTSPFAMFPAAMTSQSQSQPSILGDQEVVVEGETNAPMTDELPDIVPIEQMPEFKALQFLVLGLGDIERRGRMFNGLKESGDLRQLGELVKFGFGKELPEHFYTKADLYQPALAASKCQPFDAAPFREEAAKRALELADAFHAKLFGRNALALRLQRLSDELRNATWQWPAEGDAARFEQLNQRLRDVENALSGPAFEWAFRREFNLGDEYAEVMHTLETSQFFGQQLAQTIERSGQSQWSQFQKALSTYDAPITGQILAAPNGRPEMQLSSDTVMLKSALDTFAGQGFVANKSQGRRVRVELPPGARLQWDAGYLARAGAIAQAYDRFRDKSLQLFPADLRVTIDQVARERARGEMLDLVAQGQKFEAVRPPVSATMLEEDTRNEIGTFAAAVLPVGGILDSFAAIGAAESRREVADATSAEALRLLQMVDRLLVLDAPYRPRQGSFAWWDGNVAPSPVAWGAIDNADVAAYLDTTRSRITVLARNYAQPLLTWFAKAGTMDSPDARKLVQKWQGILDDLREYEAKRPGNAVAVLEDYILTAMPKVSPASCAAANLPAVNRNSRGFFATSLHDLSRQLTGRCYQIAAGDAVKQYAALERYFNQRLAGRYPFREDSPKAKDPEAEPEDVRGFFKLFDANVAVIQTMPSSIGASAVAAKKFVNTMAAVRRFFAPFLDAQKPEPAPSFDVEATFRILREREVDGDQIIGWSLVVGDKTITNRDKDRKVRWTAGDPVRLALRWASNAPRVPVLPAAQRGASVKDRTLEYEYRNRWALLTALAEHRASAEELRAYNDVEPVTLGLDVYTQPAGGGEPSDVPAQVFMRVAVLAPGTTTPVDVPRFPSRAPRLDTKVAGTANQNDEEESQ